MLEQLRAGHRVSGSSGQGELVGEEEPGAHRVEQVLLVGKAAIAGQQAGLAQQPQVLTQHLVTPSAQLTEGRGGLLREAPEGVTVAEADPTGARILGQPR